MCLFYRQLQRHHEYVKTLRVYVEEALIGIFTQRYFERTDRESILNVRFSNSSEYLLQ